MKPFNKYLSDNTIKTLRRAAFFTAGLFVLVSLFLGIGSAEKNVVIASEYESVALKLKGNATLADALFECGISLGLNDKLSEDTTKILADNETVIVSYAKNDKLIVPLSSHVNAITSIKQLGTLVETSGGVYQYTKKLTIEATGYCSCSICCGKYNGNRTANGSTPKAGITIAAPSAYKFGTNFYIPYFDKKDEDGIFVVQDRGGAIKNNRIDVYFTTHAQALKFGRRTLTAYVLK